MKLAKPPSTVSTLAADPLLSGAKAHFHAAAAALRQGCAEALITGMHLIALHARSNAGHGGDRRSLMAEDGFKSALSEIGIPERTAYRWMHATRNAALRTTLLMEGEDISGELPAYQTPRWEQWETQMRKLAEGMSLSRLLLGQVRDSTEDHRYEVLLSGDEDGSSRASDLLHAVAEGRYTLAQAVKALGSQEAYDKLRAEGGDKIRKDPVYVSLEDDGRVGGLVMKSLSTLMNAAKRYEGHWDEVPVQAKKEIRTAWLAVQAQLPEEIKSFKH